MSSHDRNPDETASGGRRSSWSRIDDTLERSAGIDHMPLSDEREQQVIVRALAVGYSAFRWIALAVALVLLASGLLFAAVLIMVTADIPRLIATGYARRRGVELQSQSGLARNAARPIELIATLLYIGVVAGLIAFNAAFGHPLIPWSWRFEFESFDAFLIIPSSVPRSEHSSAGGSGGDVTWLRSSDQCDGRPLHREESARVGLTRDERTSRPRAGLITSIPDYPEPGVNFRDISPLLADGPAFTAVTEALVAPFVGRFDFVGGLEARGFLFAGAIAVMTGAGILPIRKAGKLPKPAAAVSYSLEYGTATIEAPDVLHPGDRVLLVDDILATGGTLTAARHSSRNSARGGRLRRRPRTHRLGRPRPHRRRPHGVHRLTRATA